MTPRPWAAVIAAHNSRAAEHARIVGRMRQALREDYGETQAEVGRLLAAHLGPAWVAGNGYAVIRDPTHKVLIRATVKDGEIVYQSTAWAPYAAHHTTLGNYAASPELRSLDAAIRWHAPDVAARFRAMLGEVTP